MLSSAVSAATSASAKVHTQLGVVVAQLAPITLQELQAADAALLDRIDTKFILTADQLTEILTTVADTYHALTINNVSLQCYHTRYWDTPDLLFYRQHHNDYRNRYKVRCRTYLDSNLSFLEVKMKNNKGRTIKNRLKTPLAPEHLSPAMQGFLQTLIPVTPNRLTPQLINTFTRLTLVNKFSPERVTIDLDLRFAEEGEIRHYPHLVIAEVKQPRFSLNSPFVRALRSHHTQEMGFSKYCIGVALGRPEVKHNSFKPALTRIEHLL